MNSKELLELAREKAEKQLSLIDDIEKAEKSLELSVTGKICFMASGYGNVYLEDTTEPETMEVVRDMGLTAIMNYRDKKTAELEKLLGIRKPATLNPEFEAATKDMFEFFTKPESDPLEDNLKVVPEEEAKLIESPEKSLDKYPAKKKGRQPEYPESMTTEIVREMYIDQGMKINELASHFGVKYVTMSNFITRNHLHRKNQPSKTEEPKTDSDDKESHS